MKERTVFYGKPLGGFSLGQTRDETSWVPPGLSHSPSPSQKALTPMHETETDKNLQRRTTYTIASKTMRLPSRYRCRCLYLLLWTCTSSTQYSVLARTDHSASNNPTKNNVGRGTSTPFRQDPTQAISGTPNSHALAILEGNQHPLGYYDRKTPGFLNGVVLVAASNLLINILRPDDAVVWQFRIPRILWETCLMVTATSAKAPSATASWSHTSSLVYLMLSTMLWTTALTDIFFWAPFFALWSGMDNQDCSGGWFTGRPYVCVANHAKGYGRLLVTLQSLYGGVFYLNFAIAAWGEYTAHRDHWKAIQQARAFHDFHRYNES